MCRRRGGDARWGYDQGSWSGTGPQAWAPPPAGPVDAPAAPVDGPVDAPAAPVDAPVDAPAVLVPAPPARAATDEEREAASTELRIHFTEGRLDVDEFSSRLDDVWKAETTADLDSALRQLPPVPGRPRPWARPGIAPAQAGWTAPTRPAPTYRGRPVWVSVVLAIVAVWVAFALWPLWLIALAVWFVFVRRHHRRRSYGWDA
jgi:hypothetical protein